MRGSNKATLVVLIRLDVRCPEAADGRLGDGCCNSKRTWSLGRGGSSEDTEKSALGSIL